MQGWAHQDKEVEKLQIQKLSLVNIILEGYVHNSANAYRHTMRKRRHAWKKQMCFIYVTIDMISLMMVLKYVRCVSSAFLKTHTIVRITHLLHTYWHCVLVVPSAAKSFQIFLNGTKRDSFWNILLLESKWKTWFFMTSITITP